MLRPIIGDLGTGAPRRSRRRRVDRERLPDRLHRRHADRRPGQRRHRTSPHLRHRLRDLPGRHDLDPAVGLARHRSSSAACSPRSAAARWCRSRSRSSATCTPLPQPRPSARHARRDRDARLGVGAAVRRDARAVPRLAVAVLAQRPARPRRRSPRCGGRSPNTTDPNDDARIDWLGAGLLTTALVSLNLALLGSAEVQSVQGLDELTGNGGTDLRWLYPLAVVAGSRLRVATTTSTTSRTNRLGRRRAVPRSQRARRTDRQLRRGRSAGDRHGRRAAVRQRRRGRPRTVRRGRRLDSLGADRGDGVAVVHRRTGHRTHLVRTAHPDRPGCRDLGLHPDGAHVGRRHAVPSARPPTRAARRRDRAHRRPDHVGGGRPRGARVARRPPLRS